MTRYWVSWWTGNYLTEGCTTPPFQTWVTGERNRGMARGRGTEQSMCAMIDAPSEGAVWDAVERHYPDYQRRFCKKQAPDATPGDRFPDFQDRTSLE